MFIMISQTLGHTRLKFSVSNGDHLVVVFGECGEDWSKSTNRAVKKIFGGGCSFLV